VVPAVGAGLIRHRQRRHFFEIRYHDENKAVQVAIFEVSKDVPQTLLAVFANPRSAGLQTRDRLTVRRKTQILSGGRATTLDCRCDGGYALPMTLSARNHLKGTIVELEFGGVMAHVVVRVGENLIESVITKRSAEEMQLKVGDSVSAVIKSTEVMLQK
jgi:molybdopterin-binding protein